MARRGENIYRRQDGRWEGRYIKERRPDGKAAYGYVYEKKYTLCKERLEQMKAQHIYRRVATKNYGSGLVTDFILYWLNSIAHLHVKASTYSNYTSIVKKWILPSLGEKRLCKVNREDIQQFISGLSEKGLSAGTIRNIYNVLHLAMKKAQEYEYIIANPSEGIHLPKVKKKEMRILTVQEQKKLEQTARISKYGFAVILASYTGMRVGELCGLKWEDVDFENGILRVSRTIQRIQRPECILKMEVDAKIKAKTVIIVGDAKSDRSKRSIPMPSSIFPLFEEHRKTSVGEYVFSNHGKPLEPRTLQYRFKVLLQKGKFSPIHFHALRHTFATRCIELGVDVKTLSEILGHASAKMTLDRYGHSQMEHKRQAMNTLNQLLERTA